MQKIYVLLRHNQQTGPYSLEEISQFDLKPYDLIWIEGKSAGWYYPQEIGALHPYLSFLPKKEPVIQPGAEVKPVFVSRPAAPKQEPVQPQLAPKVEIPTPQPEVTYTPFIPATNNIEEQVYAQFQKAPEKIEPVAATNVSQSPVRRKPVASFGVALAVVLVVGGVFSASWLMNRQPQASEPETNFASAAPIELAATVAGDDATADPNNRSASTQKKEKSNASAKQATATNMPVVTTKQERKQVVVKQLGEEDNYTPAPSKEESPVIREETPEVPTEAGGQGEKKKKLRDKIFDLFKKKPEEQKQEEARPDAEGERNASRRNEGTNLAQSVHVRFDVPNDWMMGIKGAKATLVNRNNQTIVNATVEVQYYNDDNELLQKKVITFGKIEAKGSRTIAIPDHASATKVDYSILLVAGQPAA